QNNGLLNTLIDNCMMSKTKSILDIASYMCNDEKYGEFWTMLYDEYVKTKTYLIKVSGMDHLIENYPVERASVLEREKIILPLLIIQHYAIRKISKENLSEQAEETYRKLISRTIYGVVNAGRNLA